LEVQRLRVTVAATSMQEPRLSVNDVESSL
jgi:hypothetical protein